MTRLPSSSRKRTGGIGTGMLSLLMVLIILLLSAFAVLSYASAQAENRLTEKTIQAAESYYAADQRAEELLFIFSGYAAENTLEKTAENIQNESCKAGENLTVDRLEGNTAFSVICLLPVDSARQLRLELLLVEENGKNVLKTISRKVESTAQWEDEEIYIWDGG